MRLKMTQREERDPNAGEGLLFVDQLATQFVHEITNSDLQAVEARDIRATHDQARTDTSVPSKRVAAYVNVWVFRLKLA